MLKLKNTALLRNHAYVNGEWITSSANETFSVYDPATRKLLLDVPELSRSETIVAINAADIAFQTFKRTTSRERSNILRRWYDAMIDNLEDLATLITFENGKTFGEAQGEVKYAASFLEWFSEEAPRIYGDTIPSLNAGNRILTTREPMGVCGIITPWNFPAAMITRKVGPAVATGCTVVVKAPAETPLTALALAYLAEQAGLPKGVLNVITTLRNTPEVGEELCTNLKVKKLSFTGSTAVGKLLMEQSGSSLKKITMELGGNAPFIVFNDADVEKAVNGALLSKFRSSGQTCVCANRLYVQDSIYDDFISAFAERVKLFRLGNPFESSTTHGPLINQRATSKVIEHVEDAKRNSGVVVVGGNKRDDLGGHFYEPTVIRDLTTDSVLHREETFGPLAAVFKFATEEEVVIMANSTDVGLAAYIFSDDVNRCWRVAEALEVGMVGINTGMISDPASPFGGVKHSGFGREGSKYGIEEYTYIKSLTFGGLI